MTTANVCGGHLTTVTAMSAGSGCGVSTHHSGFFLGGLSTGSPSYTHLSGFQPVPTPLPVSPLLAASDQLEGFLKEMVEGGILARVAKNLPTRIFVAWLSERAARAEGSPIDLGAPTALSMAKDEQTKTDKGEDQ